MLDGRLFLLPKSLPELFAAFISLIETNYAVAFIITLIGMMFLLYWIYDQTRHAIADAMNKETRKLFIVASVIIAIVSSFVSVGSGGVSAGFLAPARIESALIANWSKWHSGMDASSRCLAIW